VNPRAAASRPGGLLVETSALVAIALEESDWLNLADAISAADCKTTSFNVFEAVLAIAFRKSQTPKTAHEAVLDILAMSLIEVLPFTFDMLPHAVSARQRYGRGPKRLNMGDCLSYGAAKQLGLKLLYKGDDFAATDVND
jgi:ribonuclease VapC